MLNSNQFVHSKQLYACDISQNSTSDNFKVILGTIGIGQQEIIKLQSSSTDNKEQMKSKSYLLGNAFSAKLAFIQYNDFSERFISAGEKLQIFKSEDIKISHICDLNPLSKQYVGPTSCFDFHSQQQSKLVSGSIDPTIRLWDLEKKKCQYQFIAYNLQDNPDQYTLDISFGNDLNIFAFLSNESQIVLYDIRSNIGINSVQGKLQYNQIIWNLQKEFLIAAIDYETGYIDLYDLRETKRKFQRIRENHQQIIKASWFKFNNSLATARIDKQILLYEENMEPSYFLNKGYDIDNMCCQHNLFGVVSENKFELFPFETQ